MFSHTSPPQKAVGREGVGQCTGKELVPQHLGSKYAADEQEHSQGVMVRQYTIHHKVPYKQPLLVAIRAILGCNGSYQSQSEL